MAKYKGRIPDFPEEVVKNMLERKVKQGNKKDVSVFEIKPKKTLAKIISDRFCNYYAKNGDIVTINFGYVKGIFGSRFYECTNKYGYVFYVPVTDVEIINEQNKENMNEKSVKINIPEGYEIDKKKSTFENIVFKERKVRKWDDLKELRGYCINDSSDIEKVFTYTVSDSNKNIFLTEKQAKSALALAQITQILPWYGGYTEYNDNSDNYFIMYDLKDREFLVGIETSYIAQMFYFDSQKGAEHFIENNEELLRQFFIID